VELIKIQEMKAFLEKFPKDELALDAFSMAQVDLVHYGIQELKTHQNEMVVLWFYNEDRCLQQFFDYYKTSNWKVPIQYLIVDDQELRK